MNNTTQSPSSYDNTFAEYYDYETSIKKGNDWDKLFRFFTILRECEVAVAAIFSFFGLFLLLSLFREDIRRRSIIWYTSHLILAVSFTGLSLHLLSRSEIHLTSYNACLFISYGAYYMFFVSGYTIILINIETIFTVLFPHRLWESNKVLRFAVSILLTWIVVCLCVAHILIQNNTATRSSVKCIAVQDESVMRLRLIFQDYIPAGTVFVLTITAIGLHWLQQKRSTMATDLQPLETVPVEWLRFLVTMNSVYIIHVIFIPVAHQSIPREYEYYVLSFIVGLFKSVSFYSIPFPVLFVGEMRSALKEVLKKVWKCLCAKRDPFKDIQPLHMSGILNPNQD